MNAKMMAFDLKATGSPVTNKCHVKPSFVFSKDLTIFRSCFMGSYVPQTLTLRVAVEDLHAEHPGVPRPRLTAESENEN